MNLVVVFFVQCMALQLSTCSDIFKIPLRTKRATVPFWEDNNLHGRVEKGYYIEVMIGTPPQPLNILLDTGSSNFAVASQPEPQVSKFYDSSLSSTMQDLNIADIDIEYTEGFWKGHIVSDLVSIPEAGLNMSGRVSFAKITNSKKFFIDDSGWQGILGLGYTELVRPGNSNIKSFMQSIVESTNITDMFSMQLCMADVKNYSDVTGGTFIMGGYDSSKIDEEVYWTRIVHEWYYEVIVLQMKVGNATVAVDCKDYNNDKSIVDSGTTNIHLPGPVFDQAVQMIKTYLAGAVPDNDADFWTGDSVLCWTSEQHPYDLFPTLTFYLPSITEQKTFTLTAHPRHYLLFYGTGANTTQNSTCYKFGVSSSSTGTVLGAVLMEQYIVIFDRVNGKVGFTVSDCSETSSLEELSRYPNSTTCVYSQPHMPLTPLQIAMYVFVGILLLCLLPVCVLLYIWCCSNEKARDMNDTSELLNSPVTTS